MDTDAGGVSIHKACISADTDDNPKLTTTCITTSITTSITVTISTIIISTTIVSTILICIDVFNSDFLMKKTVLVQV
jgi:hypothetical protein